MKYIIMILTFNIILACDSKKNLTLIKQWHLASHQKTNNIEKSKRIPQYKNQVEIYKYVVSRLDQNPNLVIFAEGCEENIQKEFEAEFNGWSLTKLKKMVLNKDFEHILAPIPMKLLAKYPKASILCGDNNLLIKENLKVLSDVRGFSGFYQKLKQFKVNNPKKFKIYKEQLFSIYPEARNKNVLRFSLDKAKLALKKFEDVLKKRNDVFIKNILKNKGSEFIVIIGGLHTFDLENKASAKGIKTQTITPKFYSKNESLLISGLKSILNKEVVSDISLFQTPDGMDIKKFPLTNLLDKEVILTKSEEKEIRNLIQGKLDFSLLLSDFDNDGIRDFTLSSSGTSIILSAEDPDWDNDGIDNIFDQSVGLVKISKIAQKISVNNNFFSSKKAELMINESKNYVKLGNLNEVGHELLVLEIFNQLAPMFKNRMKVLKNLIATKSTFSYGEKVFFSYISQSKTIEYYPEKLNLFVNREYQLRFKGVKFERFIQSFVVPIIIHSLAHELAHVNEDALLSSLKDKRWYIEYEKYTGLYLKSKRLEEKKLNQIKTKQLFSKKNFKEWGEEYLNYTKSVNEILRVKTKEEQLRLVKASTYYTKIESFSIEHLLSYFKKNDIPSIYSLKKFNEWRAEIFASCIYKKVFPNSESIIRSIELEHLIGLFPAAAKPEQCEIVYSSL